MSKSLFVFAKLAAMVGINLIGSLAFAQSQYPSTGQARIAPRNSNWATSQPNVIDRPGLNAFEPTGFPSVNDQDLNDISMSPDDWEQSGQMPLPPGDLNRKSFAQQFPSEQFDGRSVLDRKPSQLSVNSEANDFQPASKTTTTELFGGMIPLPPSSQYGSDAAKQEITPTQNKAPSLPLERYPLELNPPASSLQPTQTIPQTLLDQIEFPLVDSHSAGSGPARQPTTFPATPQSSYPQPASHPSNSTQHSTFGWPQDINGSQDLPGQGRWSTGMPEQVFRPDLGHRTESQTNRTGIADDGQSFDFEDKQKQYPPMKEILATGTYFASLDMYLLKPYFQNNNAIASTTGGSTNVQPFDFGFTVAPAFRAGFESKYGPGVELTYSQFDQTSNDATFTSDGLATGQISAWLPATNQLSQLSASNAGEQINATHGLDVELIGVSFFKEMKFPISRLNGIFGLQHAAIHHRMSSELRDGSGVLGTLNSESDMRAFGPRVAFEYFRPIGHTKMTLVAKFGGSLLLGNRDQIVQNSLTGDTSRIGADEMITMFDFGTAIMYKKPLGERRFLFAKLGYDVQSWMGGGNATEPENDFGFRGGVFAIGINR